MQDRRVDVILSGGVNIYPAEVEACLTSHPGTLCACLVAVLEFELHDTTVFARTHLRAIRSICLSIYLSRSACCVCPAVVDVAVFGIPDEEWGQKVHACVELTQISSPAPASPVSDHGFATDEAVMEMERALVEHCHERIARFKVPKSISFEILGRSEAGKLNKRALQDRHWNKRTNTTGKANL